MAVSGVMSAPTVLHGARSEPTVKRAATTVKRRLLRRIGLSASDLNGVGQSYLDLFARAMAKVELMDQWQADRGGGWLNDEGAAPGYTDKYLAAINTARLSLAKFDEHLVAQHKRRAPMDLSQYRSADRG